jgi:hypothetical protein
MMLLLFVLQSPYNTSNPHFGYPAYVPPSSLDPSGTPRSRFPRRRKRDLVRTLTYLAALRFLALHRSIQHRLNVLVAVLLRLTGLGWWNRWWRQGAAGRCRNAAAAAAASGSEQHRDGSDKKVHWTTSSAASSSPDTVAPPPPPTSLGRCPVAHSPHHRARIVVVLVAHATAAVADRRGPVGAVPDAPVYHCEDTGPQGQGQTASAVPGRRRSYLVSSSSQETRVAGPGGQGTSRRLVERRARFPVAQLLS